MKRILLSMVLLISAGCSSTFLVGKDGHGYFLGSGAEPLYAWLCSTGDAAKVLAATNLPEATRSSLYSALCSSSRSGDAVTGIYHSLPNDQRSSLQRAFTRHGYDINVVR